MVFSHWIMQLHVASGLVGLIVAAILWTDLREMSLEKYQRVKTLSLFIAGSITLSYLFGGYYYLTDYEQVKSAIKGGPWPFAHNYFMEVKEHLFFFLLLASFYLAFVVVNRLFKTSRNMDGLARTLAAAIVVLGLFMEGFGALIAMGYRMALEMAQ